MIHLLSNVCYVFPSSHPHLEYVAEWGTYISKELGMILTWINEMLKFSRLKQIQTHSGDVEVPCGCGVELLWDRHKLRSLK